MMKFLKKLRHEYHFRRIVALGKQRGEIVEFMLSLRDPVAADLSAELTAAMQSIDTRIANHRDAFNDYKES